MHDMYKLKLNPRDLAIYDMARIFYNMMSSHDPKSHAQWANFYNASYPQKGRNWKYFEELYEVIKNDSHFNMRWFVNAQLVYLEKGKTIWPAQLLTKKAMNNYFEYCNNRRITIKGDGTKDIIAALVHDKKFMREWLSDHPESDYADFFGRVPEGLVMSDGIYYAIQGMLSVFFLSISKNFNIVYLNLEPDLREEIATKGRILMSRDKVRLNKRALELARKIFKEEVLL